MYILLFNVCIKSHAKMCMHCWNINRSDRVLFYVHPVQCDYRAWVMDTDQRQWLEQATTLLLLLLMMMMTMMMMMMICHQPCHSPHDLVDLSVTHRHTYTHTHIHTDIHSVVEYTSDKDLKLCSEACVADHHAVCSSSRHVNETLSSEKETFDFESETNVWMYDYDCCLN